MGGGVNPVQAAVLIGNLPQNNDGGNTTTFPTNSIPTIKAIAFTLPTGKNYSLDNVILRLSGFSATSASPIVQIRNDVGTSDPGSTILASFTNPSSLGGTNNYTFTPVSPFTFSAATKYWLYVTSTTGTNFGWRSSSPNKAATGIPGITRNEIRASVNGAAFSNSTVLNTFQINATAIPEPSAIGALSLLGLSLLASKGRRREG